MLLTKSITQKHKIAESVAQMIAGEVVKAFFSDFTESDNYSHAESFIGRLVLDGIIRESEKELFLKIYKGTAEDFDCICCSIH